MLKKSPEKWTPPLPDEPPDDEDWEDEDEDQDDYDDWENEEASRAEAEYQRRYNEHLKWLYGG